MSTDGKSKTLIDIPLYADKLYLEERYLSTLLLYYLHLRRETRPLLMFASPPFSTKCGLNYLSYFKAMTSTTTTNLQQNSEYRLFTWAFAFVEHSSMRNWVIFQIAKRRESNCCHVMCQNLLVSSLLMLSQANQSMDMLFSALPLVLSSCGTLLNHPIRVFVQLIPGDTARLPCLCAALLILISKL